MEAGEWRLVFDGWSTHREGGTKVVLYAPDGTNVSLSFNLEFLCSNTKAEYEALIIELICALQMVIHKLPA